MGVSSQSSTARRAWARKPPLVLGPPRIQRDRRVGRRAHRAHGLRLGVTIGVCPRRAIAIPGLHLVRERDSVHQGAIVGMRVYFCRQFCNGSTLQNPAGAHSMLIALVPRDAILLDPQVF